MKKSILLSVVLGLGLLSPMGSLVVGSEGDTPTMPKGFKDKACWKRMLKASKGVATDKCTDAVTKKAGDKCKEKDGFDDAVTAVCPEKKPEEETTSDDKDKKETPAEDTPNDSSEKSGSDKTDFDEDCSKKMKDAAEKSDSKKSCGKAVGKTKNQDKEPCSKKEGFKDLAKTLCEDKDK
jgi:hypothetical protein